MAYTQTMSPSHYNPQTAPLCIAENCHFFWTEADKNDLMNVWCINEEFTIMFDKNCARLHSEVGLKLQVTVVTATNELQKKLELAGIIHCTH